MKLTNLELVFVGVALTAIMMLGTTNIRTNLSLYRWHTMLIAVSSGWIGYLRAEPVFHWLGIALMIAGAKAWFAPWFLSQIMRKVEVQNDSAVFIPTALAMHIGIALLALSYPLAQTLPSVLNQPGGSIGATVALSLISTGMLLMVTRHIAVSQVMGFLVIENGIYLISLTQTRGMPLNIEMGVLLDLLVAVMVTGLLLFRIKKNFEHIDVAKLNELRD